MQITGLAEKIENLLSQIQDNLFQKAATYKDDNTRAVNTWEEFEAQIKKGGFVYAHWDGTRETEKKIKDLTKATIRCIPLNNKQEEGKCILTGAPSTQRVLFAKAY